MLEIKEQPIEQEQKDDSFYHFTCIPCKKTMCGKDRPKVTKAKAIGESSYDYAECVVCLDIWFSIHRCPYCGRNGHRMWG